MTSITERLNRLRQMISEMEINASTSGLAHPNLLLAPGAFDLLSNQIPMRVEWLTPYVRICLVGRMLSAMDRLQQPRLALCMLHYQSALADSIDDEADRIADMAYDHYEGPPENYVRVLTLIKESMNLEERRLQDYTNLDVPLEIWRRRYGTDILFDPVERTFVWEECIPRVEKELASAIGNRHPDMDSCYSYWELKTSILQRHGIEWKSPAVMNPELQFT